MIRHPDHVPPGREQPAEIGRVYTIGDIGVSTYEIVVTGPGFQRKGGGSRRVYGLPNWSNAPIPVPPPGDGSAL